MIGVAITVIVNGDVLSVCTFCLMSEIIAKENRSRNTSCWKQLLLFDGGRCEIISKIMVSCHYRDFKSVGNIGKLH